MRRPFRAGAAIVFVMAQVAALAQGNAQPGASAYRIAGTVVNALTGEPVRGATVAVLAEEDSHRIAATQSGNDGRFAMDGLGAGKYQLTASKRGYSTASYDEHEEYSSAIVTGEGQDTGDLVFRLVPGAVLYGVVTADGGDPVRDVQVMLFEKPQGHEPGARIRHRDTAVTDDTGAYEFSNLHAGEYFVMVKAEPWYAHSRSAASMRKGQGSPADAALDVAYPVTYFDSTTDEASASPIALAGGSRVEADVTLHAVPALYLQVEAPRKQDGSVASPELSQTIFGNQLFLGAVVLTNTVNSQHIEFNGLAPGQYQLTQRDPPRVLELDATTSQQVEPDAGTPAIPISGTLQTANGAPLAGEAVVTLEPADSTQGFKAMESGFEKGAFSFAAVPAGEWRVRVGAGGLREPVISIAVGGRVHAGNLVTVQDRAQTLVVKVSAGGMRVEGFARKDGKGQAGAMVLLVPRDAAAFPELVRRDQSDSDGSFSLRDAAPGQYTVVAIEDGWALDWTRPEVIGRYLPGEIAVRVTEASDKVIRLSGPVPIQKK